MSILRPLTLGLRASQSTLATMNPSGKAAQDFCSFIESSPSPYFTVHSVSQRLEKAGFHKIHERDDWSKVCKAGGKYFVTRNASSIIAFGVGKKWRPANPIAMIGAHTDSPCLRIKPVSKQQTEGYIQVGVETYGGGLWHTWFDRDLSLAGRVMYHGRSKGEFHQKLIHIRKPNRQEKFEFSKEAQLLPIAGLVASELNRTKGGAGAEAGEDDEEPFQPLKSIKDRHHPYLVELIAKELDLPSDSIDDFELVLYDTQPPAIGGLHDDFIFAGRLDNLGMSYCAVEGLIESVSSAAALDKDPTVRLIALFDHEEIGSASAHGAESTFLPAVIRRLNGLPINSPPSGELGQLMSAEQALARSFLISADMAHAVHPNYVSKYEGSHRPQMNGGPVIKINANQRYLTNGPGITLMRALAERAKVPLQLFVVANGSPCGSTIGPIVGKHLGARTLDLGNPQLSMHSIRETGGVYDVDYAIRLFKQFFTDFGELEAKIHID